MTAVLLPSAEQAAVAWLKADPDLAAIHGGRVGTRLGAVLPAIRVTRVGGVPDEPWLDNPSIQLECWAADQATADLLTRTLLAVLPTVRGLLSDGRVHTYLVTSGPYWAPDDPDLSSNARYIVTVQLLITT